MYKVEFLGMNEEFATVKSSLRWVLDTIKADGFYDCAFEEKYSYRNYTVATVYNNERPVVQVRSNVNMGKTLFSIIRLSDRKEITILSYIYSELLEDNEEKDF